MKLLFANIGWMTHYQGQTITDKIMGGGSYDPAEKHEAFNFMVINDSCYGYVEPPVHSKINLQRIDPNCPRQADELKDVLVIWVSSHPKTKGSYIVGWYKNATVYSYFHESKEIRRKNFSYNIKAVSKDCILLPVDKRTFPVPRANRVGKGFLGQCNVWYADSSQKDVNDFKKEVLDYINNYKVEGDVHIIKKLLAVNAEQRKKIEEAAVDFVKKEYQNRGYQVKSREDENCGWDLDAIKGKVLLKLEVKGLGGEGMVHITRNEYDKMNQYKDDYRLCIVFNALKSPTLVIFIWNSALNNWVTETNSSIILDIETKVSYGARIVEMDK